MNDCKQQSSINSHHMKIEKQPPEVFCKKRCSQKFRKIHRKTLVADSFLIKLQVFRAFCEISENTFFTEHLRTTASENSSIIYLSSKLFVDVIKSNEVLRKSLFSKSKLSCYFNEEVLGYYQNRFQLDSLDKCFESCAGSTASPQ